jgi:2'-5' RNA ligase
MPRLFVAIDLPDAIKQQLLDLQTHIPTARWTKLEQMHLTLRFIGEVPDEQVAPIKSSLATVTASPFELTLRNVGHFPPGKRTLPRVLWVGIDKQPALNDLHQQIESALSQLGFKPDNKSFSPHITLAWLKLNRDHQDAEAGETDAVALLEVLGDKVHQVPEDGFPLLLRHLMGLRQGGGEMLETDGILLRLASGCGLRGHDLGTPSEMMLL